MNILQKIEQQQIDQLTTDKNIPEFGPGDTVPLAALDTRLPMSALYAGWQAPPSAILVQEWTVPYAAQPA